MGRLAGRAWPGAQQGCDEPAHFLDLLTQGVGDTHSSCWICLGPCPFRRCAELPAKPVPPEGGSGRSGGVTLRRRSGPEGHRHTIECLWHEHANGRGRGEGDSRSFQIRANRRGSGCAGWMCVLAKGQNAAVRAESELARLRDSQSCLSRAASTTPKTHRHHEHVEAAPGTDWPGQPWPGTAAGYGTTCVHTHIHPAPLRRTASANSRTEAHTLAVSHPALFALHTSTHCRHHRFCSFPLSPTAALRCPWPF